jgi:hypothetical protein
MLLYNHSKPHQAKERMMDMLKIYIIIALFIIIPFALPFIIIAIVRGTGRNSSSGAAAPPL